MYSLNNFSYCFLNLFDKTTDVNSILPVIFITLLEMLAVLIILYNKVKYKKIFMLLKILLIISATLMHFLMKECRIVAENNKYEISDKEYFNNNVIFGNTEISCLQCNIEKTTTTTITPWGYREPKTVILVNIKENK